MKKTLRVLYIDPTTNVVKQGFGSAYNISTIRGTSNLIQRIVYYLLTETGSNHFDSEFGSNFTTLNTLNWSSENQDVLRASITNTILDIENKIKLKQSEVSLSPEESLDRLNIDTIEYDNTIQGWHITILVTNLLGQTFTVNI